MNSLKGRHDMNVRKLLLAVVAVLALVTSLNACGNKLPDPVERKDGYAWIPIADTAFLMPEKTWLKSYGRNSTDGMVSSFNLHATAPDVQPWSPAVNDQMYPKLGSGELVSVDVRDAREQINGHIEYFYRVPQSRRGGTLEEVESDLSNYGLRKFKDPHMDFAVIYERIEQGRVKYFVDCDEGRAFRYPSCRLSFPWDKEIFVELNFPRRYVPYSIQMAEKVTAKLKEFEVAARAYQHKPSSNHN
jgi:hypothetical protein